MTRQINLKMSEKLFRLATAHAMEYGFMNLQDFIRDAMREAIYDRMKINPEYANYVLNSPETNNFLSEEESKKELEDFFRRADKAEHALNNKSNLTKETKKTKGQSQTNLKNKIKEVTSRKNVDGYKNLTGSMKKYKRVHVYSSFVLLFFEKDGTVYFVDYVHHDIAYSDDKNLLKRYASLFHL